jgi:hypothetical protein
MVGLAGFGELGREREAGASFRPAYVLFVMKVRVFALEFPRGFVNFG